MLLVFSDDWGRHPSSCQHLVRHLLPRHRVVWVNTIGMRPPSLDWSTFRRAGEKLRHWRTSKPQHAESDNPEVINPRMWPWFRRWYDRKLNERLLLRALQPIVEGAGEPVFAVTTVPIVADLMDKLAVDQWTYYCVDDFSSWPGLDQATMERMEREVIARCDKAIAVSDNLIQRLLERGKESTLLSHGVDLDFWRQPDSLSGEMQFGRLEHPLIVFWGVVDRRMNVNWMRRLANDLKDGTILLVGPQDAPEAELLKLPRVVYQPSVSLAELPRIAAAADVLVMPYADLPVTRAMQPLKLKEYLATGKPVVSSNLPAVRAWSDCLDIASTAEEFSAQVRSRIGTGVPSAQLAARQRLAAESWQAKSEIFAAIACGAGQQSERTVAISTN